MRIPLPELAQRKQPGESEQRLGVVDLGSNSFRLVEFTWVAGEWWKRTDELYDAVRIGAGMGAERMLTTARIGQALSTIQAYSQFSRATGLQEISTVATSAIRDASNRESFLARATAVSGLDIRVLSPEDEAYYGYLAACNSTNLQSGSVLDLGGGSLQLVDVEDRKARALRSWPLGAVRMTEQFMAEPDTSPKQVRALRKHVVAELAASGVTPHGQQLVALGGAVRNLATAAQRIEGGPAFGVQGFELSLATLELLIEQLASLPASERGSVRGIKPERADIILAGAVTVAAALDATGCDSLTVTEAGLREGIFFERLLADESHLFADVRRSSVLNLCGQYHADTVHVEHVAKLAHQLHDSLAVASVFTPASDERELLWASAMLHDIGTAVDYDDHHKHSRYLIINAGLPGFSPREVALIAQVARYHRKGDPKPGWLEPLFISGDNQLLLRCSAIMRICEQLERSRDQAVESVTAKAGKDGSVELELHGAETSVAKWAASRQAALFERAFGKRLTIAD